MFAKSWCIASVQESGKASGMAGIMSSALRQGDFHVNGCYAWLGKRTALAVRKPTGPVSPGPP